MKPSPAQRRTRQLRVVWEAVAEAKDHPTAEQVFCRARTRLRHISRGTVYRNLQKLVQQGRLLVVRGPDGVQHFDAFVQAHDHFVCRGCGRLTDVPLARDLDASSVERLGHVVVGRELTWIGWCKYCCSEAEMVTTKQTCELGGSKAS